ncbi:unnamed protein product, partial [marine sediment metagenome]
MPKRINLEFQAAMEALEPRLLLSAAYPDVLSIPAPADDPALPGAMDLFAPPVDQTAPGAEAPALAEWTRIAEAGETMVVSGYQLSDYIGADAAKDTQFIAYGQTTG